MDWLLEVVGKINSFLWDFLLLFLLCGTGIYFTFRLKFVQIRKFKDGFKMTFGGLTLKGNKAGKDGMSSFQSLATAIAAQVGTGNLAGAATALIAGGPGAIFWMWVSAFFGMATIFVEATLAQSYKTVKEGHVTGGPAFYIRAAFRGRFGQILAVIFSVLIIFALGFMGNMVQSNSIGDAFFNAFHIPPVYIGVIVGIFVGFIFVGGVGRIVSVTEKLVPVMALFYIIGSLIIIVFHFTEVPHAFVLIIKGAFLPNALFGGALGVTVQKALRFGVARGLFSNEAGMGSTPHAHAVAKVDHPCDQGCVAMMGVFIDTFIILTLTALVVLTTGVYDQVAFSNQQIAQGALLELPNHLKGVGLVQTSFATLFREFGGVFIAVCMLFFATSTIIGWYFFGEMNVKFLFGKKAVKFYSFIVIGFVILGSALKIDLVWSLADCFNGLMVVPNLLALLALGGLAVKLELEYDKKSSNMKKKEKREGYGAGSGNKRRTDSSSGTDC